MSREMILVLDFGGQYNQLIARRVRECNVYCEVHSYTMTLDEIKEMNPKGIIFTGGPNIQRKYLIWEYRFLVFAMDHSLWRIYLEETSPTQWT